MVILTKRIAPFPARPIDGGHPSLIRPSRPGGIFEWGPKLNGWRLVGDLAMEQLFNRHQKLLSIAGEVKLAAAQMRMALADAKVTADWADCEVLERRHAMAKGCIVLLDLIMPGTFAERRATIETINLPVAPLDPSEWVADTAYIIPNHRSTDAELREYLATLKRMNQKVKINFFDGVVGREVRSKYPPSHKNTSGLIVKHRWSDAELKNFNK